MISKDFRDFVAYLNRRDVRFLIVAGYAVGFHGRHRYTKDLDVWIDRDSGNVSRLMNALVDFGFGSVGLTGVNLLTSLSGVEFDKCYPERVSLEVEDATRFFISLEGLKQNKRAMGRYQDLADLEKLGD